MANVAASSVLYDLSLSSIMRDVCVIGLGLQSMSARQSGLCAQAMGVGTSKQSALL